VNLILAHGGTTGLALELSLLLIPAVILFFLMRRARRYEAEGGDEAGPRRDEYQKRSGDSP
jgi:hypothetical protein